VHIYLHTFISCIYVYTFTCLYAYTQGHIYTFTQSRAKYIYVNILNLANMHKEMMLDNGTKIASVASCRALVVVLQRTATHCNTLTLLQTHCTRNANTNTAKAFHPSRLPRSRCRTATHGNTLQRTHMSALQHTQTFAASAATRDRSLLRCPKSRLYAY